MLDYGRARIETTRPRRTLAGRSRYYCPSVAFGVVGQQDMESESAGPLLLLCLVVDGMRAWEGR